MADPREEDSKGERGTVLNNRGTNEPTNMIFTDLQIFDCYICFKPLTAPVYQCKNGHISCSSCCTKVQKKCPSCRLAIGIIRCRAIEKVLESIKIPCQNSKYGCQMTMNFNQNNDHEPSCMHQPCSCPLPDCLFVGSSEQLCVHFTKKHKNSAKSFSYRSRFTICLDSGDSYRILQAEKDGTLFFLYYTFEIFGNAVTLSRVGPSSSLKKFRYEIRAKTHGSVLSFLSIESEIQAWMKVTPSKGSLLIPNDFFGSSARTMEFLIWPAP